MKSTETRIEIAAIDAAFEVALAASEAFAAIKVAKTKKAVALFNSSFNPSEADLEAFTKLFEETFAAACAHERSTETE